MKKLKIVFYAFLAILFLGLIIWVILLSKKSKEWENSYFEEKYNRTHYQTLYRQEKKKSDELFQEAEMYKSKVMYYENKMDSVYAIAKRDNDKVVMEFFRDKPWNRRHYKD